MSGHSIVWEFDSDHIRGDVVCDAPEGADCRLGPESYATCECEAWHTEREENGRPYHVAEWGDGERHYMTDTGECHAVLFLQDTAPIEEMCAVRYEGFEIGRTPIEPVWEIDHVTWKRAPS